MPEDAGNKNQPHSDTGTGVTGVDVRRVPNLKPEIGWRRVASVFIDFSIVLLPTIYVTLLFAAFSGTPIPFIHNQFKNTDSSLIRNTFLLIILTGYLLYCKLYVGTTLGKKICGMSIVMHDTEFHPTSRVLFKRSLILVILLVILLSTNKLAALFLWFIIDSLFSNHQVPSSLTRIGVPSIYFLLFYIPLISFWKRRGIPDIIAGTKVIHAHTGWSTKRLMALIALFLFLYFLIQPVALYLERAIEL